MSSSYEVKVNIVIEEDGIVLAVHHDLDSAREYIGSEFADNESEIEDLEEKLSELLAKRKAIREAGEAIGVADEDLYIEHGDADILIVHAA